MKDSCVAEQTIFSTPSTGHIDYTFDFVILMCCERISVIMYFYFMFKVMAIQSSVIRVAAGYGSGKKRMIHGRSMHDGTPAAHM